MAAGVQYSKQKVAPNPLSIRYGSSMAINTENTIPMIKALFLMVSQYYMFFPLFVNMR